MLERHIKTAAKILTIEEEQIVCLFESHAHLYGVAWYSQWDAFISFHLSCPAQTVIDFRMGDEQFGKAINVAVDMMNKEP